MEKRDDKFDLLAIGASTGGTEAIRNIVQRFPADMPGVVITQHMPAGFTKLFARTLNSVAEMEVREAKDGDPIERGTVLIAPGNMHMYVDRVGMQYRVKCRPGEKVCGHCPSVQVLMYSVARVVGPRAVAVILTGMGRDGAEGIHAVRQAGGRTIAQDQNSSVIFGMPRVAYEIGAIESLVPLPKIAPVIMNMINHRKQAGIIEGNI